MILFVITTIYKFCAKMSIRKNIFYKKTIINVKKHAVSPPKKQCFHKHRKKYNVPMHYQQLGDGRCKKH